MGVADGAGKCGRRESGFKRDTRGGNNGRLTGRGGAASWRSSSSWGSDRPRWSRQPRVREWPGAVRFSLRHCDGGGITARCADGPPIGPYVVAALAVGINLVRQLIKDNAIE